MMSSHTGELFIRSAVMGSHHPPRGDSIDPDSFWSVTDSHGAGESDHPPFACDVGVCVVGGTRADQCIIRGDVYDTAPAVR